MTVEAITAAALALPPETRAELVETLLHSLDDSTAAKHWSEWEAEINDRIAAYDRGDIKALTREELERFVDENSAE